MQCNDRLLFQCSDYERKNCYIKVLNNYCWFHLKIIINLIMNCNDKGTLYVSLNLFCFNFWTRIPGEMWQRMIQSSVKILGKNIKNALHVFSETLKGSPRNLWRFAQQFVKISTFEKKKCLEKKIRCTFITKSSEILFQICEELLVDFARYAFV